MLRYYGQFQPPVDQIIFERYFQYSHGPGTYIECGAFDGINESSCYFLEKYLSWKAINIEPSPAVYAKLIHNRPQSTNLNLALSNRNGTSSFTLVKHPKLKDNFGNSSIKHSTEHMKELVEMGCEFDTVEIVTSTYQSLIQKLEVPRLDLMVLDVEGHELSVLEGMVNSSVLPDVFVIEYGHLGEQVIINEVARLGYELDTKSHANLFFVKTPCRPEILQSIVNHDSRMDLKNEILKLQNESHTALLEKKVSSLEHEVVMLKAQMMEFVHQMKLSFFFSPRSWILRKLSKR